ncbi:hypothetical protein [Streptosporangium sp. NPDC023615]|uniref:hypothetical protein n=1 Tax=Streptosporangium sp. NPDC023615 TaxID=3154794 RepID=UPI003448E7F7
MTTDRKNTAMGSGHRTITVYFGVFAGLLLAGLAMFAPLPPWIWAVLAALAGAAVLLFVRGFGRGTRTAPTTETAYVPPPPLEPLCQRIEVTLSSMEEDYDFLFSATVRWSPIGGMTGDPDANLGGLAIGAVLERARSITENRPPGRASLVQHELNGALGTMQPDATGRVRAMADSIALTLSDHDRQRLDRLAEIRKQKAVWEHERKHEQSRRDYLGQDVLKDPGSAVVWWLAKNDEQVEKVVEDLDSLARLSSAANNREVPEYFRNLVSWPPSHPSMDGDEPFDSPAPQNGGPFRPPPEGGASAADIFAAFLGAAGYPEGGDERVMLGSYVADYLARSGRQDVADDLRRRFDPFMAGQESSSSAPPDPGPSTPSDRPDEASPPTDDLE